MTLLAVRVSFRWQIHLLLAGSALLSIAGCTRVPEVIVLAATATPAGAIVPTRVPTELPAEATFTPALMLTSTSVPTSATPPPSTESATPSATSEPATPTAAAEPATASPTLTPTLLPTATETPAPGLVLAGMPMALAAEAAVGSFLPGEITDRSPHQIYQLAGEAGTILDLKLDASGDLQPLLLVIDAAGREIARTQSGTASQSELLRGLELANDPYYAVVTRAGGSDGYGVGAYNLSVSAGSPELKSGIFSQPVGYESLDDGVISDAAPEQVFVFDGVAGDIISAQVTVLGSSLDPRLMLSDPLGNVLAINDDDPASGTFDSAINRFVLPASGPYTLNIQRYGETAGDFRLKLTREGQAGPGSPLQAPLDLMASGSIRDDNLLVTDFRAGDQINEAGQELRVQTLLTFHLPVLPAGALPRQAQLVLLGCSEGGAGFAGLGPLSLYLDSYGELNVAGDFTRLRPGSRLLTEANSCENLDVTNVVAAAYAAGDRDIQFRLAFRAANNSGQGDEVRFDPRLMISVGE
ncbi:MAG: hypothetical protein JNL34_09200 [Anaerolineae bacterium]|nr:hypothetical protein [Anaerolineae bacterium]